ncbi:carbohydrate ABC transporter permease [Paenibacillus flagellatus]|uniref:ABC transporter permease n=1 Tax=Paenibacillus flagellatus TaxID=2211139 RepID=A0A2V5KEP8_9BACL|nr:carbohydrate ABC transporter permease [Paenibacillus flagellatus]PYI56613.1 ABC transporter permease [Paenibacillus flagellatus]
MRKSAGETLFDWANYLFLSAVALAMLYPFWHVLVRSVLPYEEAIRSAIHVFPTKVTFDAYKYVFTNGGLMRGVWISLFVTFAGTAYQLLITAMTSYALTIKALPGRNLIISMIVFTMFFGGGLIPYYLLIRSLHLVDNLLVMIVPAAISTFNMIVMKTFMDTLPKELEESAMMDGAGYFKIFVRLIMPLSVPVMATIGLFIAVGQWNNWMTAMLFLNKRELWPLALILRDILIDNNTELTRQTGYTSDSYLLGESIKMAVVIVSVIPIVAVYPFIQKYFVKGVMIGSLKG